MADLPSISGPKVNDIEVAQEAPITEALEAKFGGLINGLLAGSAGKVQQFTAPGTFTPDEQTTRVLVLGCGGGGAGSGGGGTEFDNGGDGAMLYVMAVSVTPLVPINVVIGAGGNGASSGSGSDGVNSSFGSIIFRGGLGGEAISSGGIQFDFRPTTGGAMGARGSAQGTGARNLSPAEGSGQYIGGTSNTVSGGGGAGPFGNGTNPGTTSAGANTGAGSGAGGGSGAGNGGSGRVIVLW